MRGQFHKTSLLVLGISLSFTAKAESLVTSKSEVLKISVAKEEALSPRRLSVINHSLEQAKSLLPKAISNGLKKYQIEIVFKSSKNTNGHVGLIRTLFAKMGLAKSLQISINKKLLSKKTQSKLTRTLLHELTHLYEMTKSREERIVNDPHFLNIAGWSSRKVIDSHQELEDKVRIITDDKNYMTLNSPDVYELTNPDEYLAVNMEHYLTDPSYKCKRPLHYEYFSKSLSHDPHKNIKCDQLFKYIDPQTNEIKTIEFSRIYQIHYQLAAEGENFESRWGHSSFRLVICAPGKEPGPDCIKDAYHHLTLSFAAFLNEIQLDYVKGLLGGYPSKLNIETFISARTNYTLTEFRDIYSFPIKLTQVQKERFLNQAMNIYWGYHGDYKFLTNNCTSESVKLLRTAIQSEGWLIEDPISPYGLLSSLVDTKLVEDVRNLPEKELEFSGYYYKSNLQKLNSTIVKLKNIVGPSGDFDDFRSYEKLSQIERQFLIDSLIREYPKQAKLILAYFFRLEGQMGLLYATQAENQFKSAMMNDENQTEAVVELKELISKIQSKALDTTSTKNGLQDQYGIPTQFNSEKQTKAIAELNKEMEKLKNTYNLEQLKSQMIDENLLESIEKNGENLHFIKELLKHLYKEAS